MWYLVRKDLRLTARRMWSYPVLGIVLAAAFAKSGSAQTMLLTFVAISVWNFAARVCYLEEKNKTYGFLWTLPCKRSQFVIGKYLAVASVWLLSVVVLSLAASAFQLIGLTTESIFPLPLALVWASPFLVMVGFYLLMAFRVGYFKATTNMRLLLLVFLLPTLIPAEVLRRVFGSGINVISSPAFGYLLPAGVALLYLLFAALAVAVFERKELTTLA